MDKDTNIQIVEVTVTGRPSEDVESPAREAFSHRAINDSEDMPADQKDRYIHFLVDKANDPDLEKRAMELATEEFRGIHDNALEQLAALQRSLAELKAELHEEHDRRKRAEAKIRTLERQLKSTQKNGAGDKRRKARKDNL